MTPISYIFHPLLSASLKFSIQVSHILQRLIITDVRSSMKFALLTTTWYGYGGSNSNAFRHKNLNLACLPFPSYPHIAVSPAVTVAWYFSCSVILFSTQLVVRMGFEPINLSAVVLEATAFTNYAISPCGGAYRTRTGTVFTSRF